MESHVFTTESIAKSSNVTSKELILRQGCTNHALSLYVTGDGTLQMTPYVSIGGNVWVSCGAQASMTKTSGPGSDGKNIIPLSLKPGELIRFYFAETGGSSAVVISSAWFSQK